MPEGTGDDPMNKLGRFLASLLLAFVVAGGSSKIH
jgi:hypothetical protein